MLFFSHSNLNTHVYLMISYHNSNIKRTKNMYVVVKRFISNVVKEYEKHPISTDRGTWYPQTCRFLKLDHHIHSFVYKNDKSITERTMQYIKDITECFDDYFSVPKKEM